MSKTKRYSVKDYAKLKGVSVTAIYKAIHTNRLAYEKAGSVYLIITKDGSN